MTMGIAYRFRFTHAGEDGGLLWYGVEYPLGATRYYSTREAADSALAKYTAAIEATGGYVFTIDGEVSV